MSFVEFERREEVCAVAMTISLSVGDGEGDGWYRACVRLRFAKVDVQQSS